jgi:chorismate lyase
MAASKGDLQVVIVRQFIGRPSLSESQALALPRHQLALVREVILQGCGQPWIFARSLLPLSSLQGKLRHLRKQHTRPLGAFLFSQPHLARSPIALATLNPHDGYLPAQLNNCPELWGRRSVFWLAQKPLLVSEVFLPAFCTYHHL